MLYENQQLSTKKCLFFINKVTRIIHKKTQKCLLGCYIHNLQNDNSVVSVDISKHNISKHIYILHFRCHTCSAETWSSSHLNHVLATESIQIQISKLLMLLMLLTVTARITVNNHYSPSYL